MIAPSLKSQRTFNPIRNIVDNLKPPADHPKKLLNLALGDPTVHGNLTVPSVLTEAVQDLLVSNAANGYLPSVGLTAARKAIAQYSTVEGFPVAEENVIIASGCSGAIELALSAILNEGTTSCSTVFSVTTRSNFKVLFSGDNILVPRPGFPLYQVITQSMGGTVKHYPLKPEESWNCDLEAMEKLIDTKTKVIVVSNPSNPCGSNYSAEHLKDICAVARKHNIMILADEIYAGLVFTGKFHPIHVHSGDVPIISVGGK
jgi:tyrosine aminotransferase